MTTHLRLLSAAALLLSLSAAAPSSCPAALIPKVTTLVEASMTPGAFDDAARAMIAVDCTTDSAALPTAATSIVIPSCGNTKERLQYLRRTLASLAQSDLARAALYIVENCGAGNEHLDASWAEIKSFAVKGVPVVKIRTPPLGGVSFGAHVGLSVASDLLRKSSNVGDEQHLAVLEADVALATPAWLGRVRAVHAAAGARACMVTGFKARQHPSYEEGRSTSSAQAQMRDMVSLSGVHLHFSAALYRSELGPLLASKVAEWRTQGYTLAPGVDWLWSEHCSKIRPGHGGMFATRPSVVQHIGIAQGLTSGGADKVEARHQELAAQVGRVEALWAEVHSRNKSKSKNKNKKAKPLTALPLTAITKGVEAPARGVIHRRVGLSHAYGGRFEEAIVHWQRSLLQGNDMLQEQWGNLGMALLDYFRARLEAGASVKEQRGILRRALTCTNRAIELNTVEQELGVADDFPAGIRLPEPTPCTSWQACGGGGAGDGGSAEAETSKGTEDAAPSSSTTCPWDHNSNGEASTTTAPALKCPGPPRFADLKYLLFDGHGGPLQSMFSFLVSQLGVPSRNIGVACYPFGCNRLHLNIPVPIHRHVELERWSPLQHEMDNMDPIYDEGWRALFVSHFKSLVDQYDVLLCTQPMKLCSLLRGFSGKVVVLRADKRFDHRVGLSDYIAEQRFGAQPNRQVSAGRRLAWAHELAAWAAEADAAERASATAATTAAADMAAAGSPSSPPLVMLHANPYDEAYLRHYLGVRSTLLESYPVWPRWQATWTPEHTELIALPDQEALGESQRGAWRQAAVSPLQQAGIAVRFMREAYPVFSFNELSSHRAMLFMPYDANTWTQREMYALGIPMFAPSHRLLAKLHCETGIMGHRTANNTGNAPPSYTAAEIAEIKGAHPNSDPWSAPGGADPNSGDCADVDIWAKFVDNNRQPGLFLFDSAEHLKQLVREVLPDTARLEAASQTMLQSLEQDAATQTASFGARLLRALDRAAAASGRRRARDQEEEEEEEEESLSWAPLPDGPIDHCVAERLPPRESLTRERILTRELRDLARQNDLLPAAWAGCGSSSSSSTTTTTTKSSSNDDDAELWLGRLEQLAGKIIKNGLLPTERNKATADLFVQMHRMVGVAFCLRCKGAPASAAEKRRRERFGKATEQLAEIEAAFEDETARLVRRCWALFKKWKPSGRLDDYTETKSHVILGSLQKAGANAKDLANAGALMLNFAREIQDKQDGIKALKLSARASELALEMNPGNSQAQSNLAAARNNLQHMY